MYAVHACLHSVRPSFFSPSPQVGGERHAVSSGQPEAPAKVQGYLKRSFGAQLDATKVRACVGAGAAVRTACRAACGARLAASCRRARRLKGGTVLQERHPGMCGWLAGRPQTCHAAHYQPTLPTAQPLAPPPSLLRRPWRAWRPPSQPRRWGAWPTHCMSASAPRGRQARAWRVLVVAWRGLVRCFGWAQHLYA